MTISIAVYDDRVEIANPGILPPKITPENIKESHESFPYNRNMAHALYRSTFLESWGSGIRRIIDACREQGVEEPTWRWDGAFVYVIFKRPKQTSSRPQAENQLAAPEEPVGNQLGTSSPQVRLKFASSSPQVRQLVDVMDDKNYSIRELTELCGFIDPKHFRENYLNPALEKGAIERLYPDRPNHPKQKYRLTEAAKEWKEFNFKS